MTKYKHEKKRFSGEELKRRTYLVNFQTQSRCARECATASTAPTGLANFDCFATCSNYWDRSQKGLFPTRSVPFHACSNEEFATHRDAARATKFDLRALDAHAHGVLLLSCGAIPVVFWLSDTEGITTLELSRLSRWMRPFQELHAKEQGCAGILFVSRYG